MVLKSMQTLLSANERLRTKAKYAHKQNIVDIWNNSDICLY